MVILDNIHDQEIVHQRCILITGRCDTSDEDGGHVEVTVTDDFGRVTFPEQRWPMSHGLFKALVILAPGHNTLHLSAGKGDMRSTKIRVQYVPLTQTPPLHLAIMVAKDSPLLIDCPPGKYGALSSAHSSLDAAIAKLRVTAYMWQALTAEEMRSNDLGRRSFRLEDEWTVDTISQEFDKHTGMQSTAKVHLIRTEKTVAQLRDADIAQQNEAGSRRNELHEIFTESLLAHGSPFTRDAHPVVAGMVLDSHYDSKAKMIVGHAALGAHDPEGLSLGIFGSHLTYSWPRFMEEVPDCLLDTAVPGDRLGDDNGECASMWEACSVGQGAFLHEVGHAFSASHTTGIMARGYSKDWPKSFLSRTAYCNEWQTEGVEAITKYTPNNCHWDIRDLLRFRNLPHFRLPSDPDLSDDAPHVELQDDDDFSRIIVSSSAGIGQILLNGEAQATPSVKNPLTAVQYTLDELESRFKREDPLEMEVMGMNGKSKTLDLWKFFANQSFIRIPGCSFRLQKRGVSAENIDNEDWPWVVLFKKRGQDRSLVSVSKIDVRVGCGLDGAIIYYKDGSSTPCGPRGKNGQDLGMGGHQAKKMAVPKNAEISKIAVTKCDGSWDLTGLRIFLSNGSARGALNKSQGGSVEVITPGDGHRVIGFYGTSGPWGMCKEFGIVTAPRDQEIPDSIYDMPELQNSADASSRRGPKRRKQCQSDTEDEDTETSEDEDTGYDDDDSDIDDN